MQFLNQYLLNLLILLPALGGIGILFLREVEAQRRAAMTTTCLTFAISLLLLVAFDWKRPAFAGGGMIQLIYDTPWIPLFDIHYRVGVDGLSIALILLTTFIFPLAVMASWKINKMTRAYFAMLLLLESGILGVFLSLDLFLFYVFFEVSLVPMYFLIGIWGGPKREYAAIKFFLYTLVGSIALLIAIIGIYLHAHTFDLMELPAKLHGAMSPGLALTFFALLMVGFLVKVPAVPLHTWLPDAHVEAPTPISMILAAILLKMGGYGIFRVAYPLFPDAAKSLWMITAIIGVVSILYGALCAMAQTDFKRLVAYSSISHMGFVLLGAAMMNEIAFNGALFMMVAHGITSAALFFIVGVVYDRAHHRELARFGGLASAMPIYTTFSTILCFANLGLPGLCGFIGEIMVLLGTFAAAREGSVLRVAGASPFAIQTLGCLACLGIILTAGYMLWTIQRVFLGAPKMDGAEFPEIDRREIAVLTPLSLMALLLGILPTLLVFSFTQSTIAALVRLLT